MIDSDAVVTQLGEARLTDETINDTTFYFVSNALELPPDVSDRVSDQEIHLNNMITPPRLVVAFMGSYAIGATCLPDALPSIKLSEDFAHEAEHLRQYQDGELTVAIKVAGLGIPYASRLGEQQAYARGTAYKKALDRGEREFLAWAIFKSAQSAHLVLAECNAYAYNAQ